MSNNIRQFIEKWILRADILMQSQLRDQAENELLEAIEKDWQIEYSTIPKGPDDTPFLIAKYKETWREGFQAARKGKLEKDQGNAGGEVKYRVGRHRNRVILTQDGTKEVAVIFAKGYEELAQRVTDAMNLASQSQPSKEVFSRADDLLKEKLQQAAKQQEWKGNHYNNSGAYYPTEKAKFAQEILEILK